MQTPRREDRQADGKANRRERWSRAKSVLCANVLKAGPCRQRGHNLRSPHRCVRAAEISHALRMQPPAAMQACASSLATQAPRRAGWQANGEASRRAKRSCARSYAGVPGVQSDSLGACACTEDATYGGHADVHT